MPQSLKQTVKKVRKRDVDSGVPRDQAGQRPDDQAMVGVKESQQAHFTTQRPELVINNSTCMSAEHL